nr:hypothetical protein [Liquorilactobacillus satsumensis]
MKLEKETDIEQAGRDYLAQLLTSDKEKSPRNGGSHCEALSRSSQFLVKGMKFWG